MSTHPQAANVAAVASPIRRDALEAFRAGYGRVLEWLVSALMIILFVEVTAGVVFRGVGQSLIWYDEIASVLLAWLTFYGAALASVKRAHIGCPELLDAMPPRPRRAFNIVAQLLVIGFFALLGYVGASIMPILATDALVSVPEIPMSIVQSVIPISSLLIIVAEGIQLVALIRDRAPMQAPGAALSDALH
ncbi:MAG TPA: TRAP transporter small permease [Casimicrobiaceae bacterium]|jgi:TRAP-type C4-dicarboxylate transport system permease small subunit|nr:TRAP transporter small permease [Casimicrobiaceae bacterium]HWD15845.1 TRAP transporter small permease [Casimicrobiaceae bacterium]